LGQKANDKGGGYPFVFFNFFFLNYKAIFILLKNFIVILALFAGLEAGEHIDIF
jgi:hypothetical protein